MSNVFQRVGLTAPKYNWFDMNHPCLTSFDIGKLVPKCFEVFAGDRVKIGMEHLIRFQQMYAPVFQRFDVRFDVGFYPSRLVWPEALDFFRGGNSGNTEYPYPRIYAGYIYYAVAKQYLSDNGLTMDSSLQGNPFLHSLIDYFSLSTFDDLYDTYVGGSEPTYALFINAALQRLLTVTPLNILPFVMYQGFFRQWYRNKQVDVNVNEDQDWQFGQPEYWRNFQNWTVYLPDIPVYDLLSILPPAFRNTRPTTYQEIDAIFAEIGSGETQMKVFRCLFGVQDVRFTNDYFTSCLPSPLMPEVQIPMGNVGYYDSEGNLLSENFGNGNQGPSGATTYATFGVEATKTARTGGSLRIDAGTIQMLRQASAMDQYMIRSSLGGNGTSQDWLLAHYGVKSSDARLDYPHMINRVKSFVSISEVTQTSESTDISSLGEFAGHGISVNNHGLCDFFVEEPGYMFIFMSVVPKQAYFQGIPKMFTRHDRFDFPIPEFAQIGMEPVDVRELYLGAGDNVERENGTMVLGYQDRYAFDKTMLPEIHGDFRSSLSSWHDSRIFNMLPGLNSAFISVRHDRDGLDRIFNVTDAKENKLLALLQYHVSIERALPVYPRYSL